MNPAPPKINTPGSRPLFWVLMASLAGIAALVFFVNPTTHAIYPVCQFHRLTGLNCPGCGMTRAGYALLHGQFSVALRDNAVFVFGLGILAIRGAWFGVKKLQGRAAGEFFPTKWLWLLLVLTVIFAGLRNLPAFAFLSP